MSLGMPRSTSDQRMPPRMAPVALVAPTVPRAAEGGKTIEDKDKGKAGEGQDLRRRREQCGIGAEARERASVDSRASSRASAESAGAR